jgi:hypothetical protein
MSAVAFTAHHRDFTRAQVRPALGPIVAAGPVMGTPRDWTLPLTLDAMRRLGVGATLGAAVGALQQGACGQPGGWVWPSGSS